MITDELLESSGIKQVSAYIEIKLSELNKLIEVGKSNFESYQFDLAKLSKLKQQCDSLKANDSTEPNFHKYELQKIIQQHEFSGLAELQAALEKFKSIDDFKKEKTERDLVVKSSGINEVISLLEHKKSKHPDAFKHLEPLLQGLCELKQEMECNPLLIKESSQNRLYGLLNQEYDFSKLSASRIAPKLIGTDLERKFNELKKNIGAYVDFSQKGHGFFSQRESASSSVDHLAQNKKGA